MRWTIGVVKKILEDMGFELREISRKEIRGERLWIITVVKNGRKITGVGATARFVFEDLMDRWFTRDEELL